MPSHRTSSSARGLPRLRRRYVRMHETVDSSGAQCTRRLNRARALCLDPPAHPPYHHRITIAALHPSGRRRGLCLATLPRRGIAAQAAAHCTGARRSTIDGATRTDALAHGMYARGWHCARQIDALQATIGAMEAEAHKTALAQAAPAPVGPPRPPRPPRQPMGFEKARPFLQRDQGAAAAARQMAPRQPHLCRSAASLLRAESLGVRSRAMRAATDATVGQQLRAGGAGGAQQAARADDAHGRRAAARGAARPRRAAGARRVESTSRPAGGRPVVCR